MALAVVPMDTGQLVGVNQDKLFVSASSAKTWWTAAALANASLADVALHAPVLFEESSDAAASEMIALAGGATEVNLYTDSLGMSSTGLVRWIAGGRTHYSFDYPGPLYEGSNFTTAADAAKIPCPVAVLHGDADDTCDLEDGRAIAAAAPQGELTVVAGGTHNQLLGADYAAVHGALERFFARL